MASIALKNLFHDKVRLSVTLIGIVFSVILAAVQLGIFQGFIAASTNIIANSKADLWITSTDVTHVEQGVEFSERKLYQVLAIAGVERAEKQIVSLGGNVKKPNGSSEGVTLVGFDLQGGMGGAWNIVRGSLKDLESPDSVLVDELYAADKLGVTEINQIIELNNRRARVVGFTRGIRIFTSQPAVFTSFKNAQSYMNLREDQTLYIVVKAEPDANIEELKHRIAARLKDVEVWTTGELAHQQMMYWVFGTGAGITVLIAAALAIIVGIVVVAQTIYAATIDHLKEYGTLKAMGASNFYLYRVIIAQSTMSGVIGYVLGIIVSLLISRVSMEGTLAIIVNWQLVAALFVTTILMCVGASIVSINKVTKIDPAMVFKG